MAKVKTADGVPGERRTRKVAYTDEPQTLRLIAKGEGYAMVRVVGCGPFVMTLAEWLALPLAQKDISPCR